MNQLYEYRPSPIYALFKASPPILWSLLLLFAAFYLSQWIVLAALAVMLAAFYRYFDIRAVRYVLTAKALLVTTGLWNKRTDHTELFRLKDYVIRQPALLRIFGLMHLTLMATDATHPQLTLRAIPAGNLPEVLQELVRKARQHNPIVEIG